ncbi:hypothetical protein DF122_09030 [Burkholderia pseudomallei]|nr:hypothetical protein DF127_08385 [Burkholderia pseudomallei]RPE24139.1 hypothetical protein DF068_07030 [Burkholderia pseudomallei]RQS97423.1 hypothetical protein DF125_07370 [Burkholderia pseudomallei]RQZ53918.1 hypothetical protein DF060_12510 [Burkholderia pseudomallei]RSK68536.1 hypothetical protein DF122_09030 [Burkholderia pseudomallei]
MAKGVHILEKGGSNGKGGGRRLRRNPRRGGPAVPGRSTRRGATVNGPRPAACRSAQRRGRYPLRTAIRFPRVQTQMKNRCQQK